MLFVHAANLESLSYGWLFAKTIIIMVVIIVIAFFAIKYLMPHLVRLRHRKESEIEILDYQPLEQRKAIYIVRIENKKIAVGVTDHSMNTLCEWDD
ncbi:MAG: flagellar biosynthetic protein FliO [bacterium]|nr:flagellar biosynthetic protein FliO [bacterium]MBU1918591.1 flagellar biosynthetic protein FliO [bacterium]